MMSGVDEPQTPRATLPGLGPASLARSGTLEFEPHLAAALVDSPAAGDRSHEVEAPSAQAVEVARAHGPLEPAPLVGHLDPQTIHISRRADPDLPAAVHERVRDQFADQQLRVEFTTVQVRPNALSQPPPRDPGRLGLTR